MAKTLELYPDDLDAKEEPKSPVVQGVKRKPSAAEQEAEIMGLLNETLKHANAAWPNDDVKLCLTKLHQKIGAYLPPKRRARFPEGKKSSHKKRKLVNSDRESSNEDPDSDEDTDQEQKPAKKEDVADADIGAKGRKGQEQEKIE